MDFAKFDSRQRGEEGAWLHLKHPSNSKIAMFADLEKQEGACRVKVRSVESRQANEVAKLLKAAKQNNGNQTLEEIHARLVKIAKPLIIEFENVDRGEAPCTASNDDVTWFLNLQQINGRANIGGTRGDDEDEKSFVEQVLEFSVKRGNYLPAESNA